MYSRNYNLASNPLGITGNNDRLPFSPYYTFKDLITLFIFIFVLSLFVFFMPNALGDSENYQPANAMSTPAAIISIFVASYNYLLNISYAFCSLLNYAGPYSMLFIGIRSRVKSSYTTDRLGSFEGTKMTLKQVIDHFKKKKDAYQALRDKNEKGSREEFRELANGFWQAEGYVGGFFRSALNFYPLMTATQLLSAASINFFLRLDNALSNKGSFSITMNRMNKFVIVYRLSGWVTFFSVFVPYFHMLYGAKFKALTKLIRIHDILKLLRGGNFEQMLKVELVYLAYTLTGYKSRCNLDIIGKLTSLGLEPKLVDKLSKVVYPENTIAVTFLFVLGFFLGDGNLHLKLLWKNNKGFVITPEFSIDQSAIPQNKEIMNRMTQFLSKLGIICCLAIRKKMYCLMSKGIENVFRDIFPLLVKHAHFLY